MFQLSQMPNFKHCKIHKSTGVRTRSSKKKLISFKRPYNEKYKRSITYQLPNLWNLLPGYFQKIDSYHDFNSQVKKLFQFSKSKLKPKPKSNENKIYCAISLSPLKPISSHYHHHQHNHYFLFIYLLIYF